MTMLPDFRPQPYPYTDDEKARLEKLRLMEAQVVPALMRRALALVFECIRETRRLERSVEDRAALELGPAAAALSDEYAVVGESRGKVEREMAVTIDRVSAVQAAAGWLHEAGGRLEKLWEQGDAILGDLTLEAFGPGMGVSSRDLVDGDDVDRVAELVEDGLRRVWTFPDRPLDNIESVWDDVEAEIGPWEY